MIDTEALSEWIHPRLLDLEEIDEARTSFREHPARLLVLDDFLQPEVAERISVFLSQEAEYRIEYGLQSADGAVAEDVWEVADPSDRFYRLSRLAEVPGQYRFSPNALAYLMFRQAVPEPALVGYFAALTGMALRPSQDFGVHSMTTGDFLGPHSDDNKHRGLAFVLYLSPDWQLEYGGELVMVDAAGAETTVAPAFNRIVMFDVRAGSMHRVARVDEASGGTPRLTVGGWYDRME